MFHYSQQLIYKLHPYIYADMLRLVYINFFST